MDLWILLFPFLSAVAGFVISIITFKAYFHTGKFQKKKRAFAEQLGGIISKDVFLLYDIEKTISNPNNFQKVKPLIELHVNDFLRVKLPTEMPYITAFIGDKTYESLKKIFMVELESLFPEVMSEYVKTLNKPDIEKIISERLAAFSNADIGFLLKPLRNAFIIYGLSLAFIIGGLNIVFLLITNNKV